VKTRVPDKTLAPVPLGSWGELCIVGNGLARGEGEPADRTAARFVPDAWSGEVGGCLVRTGQIVRHLPDGDLEFQDRRADQSQGSLRRIRNSPR
jgi:non-ribosomal peptide synthetase component F